MNGNPIGELVAIIMWIARGLILMLRHQQGDEFRDCP